MKNSKTLLAILAGSLVATAASAQVEVTITGSTAFRAITIDRAAFIFDAAGRNFITNDAAVGLITLRGTMAGKTTLGTTPVTVRLSFSGSASGMLAVKNSTPVSTAESTGPIVNVNKVPDLALSDVFPGSATPPIAESSFNRDVLGVIPFVYVRNIAMTGVNGITREQAVLLMNSSGSVGGFDGMPATFLGGSSPNPVYMIGRDAGSGTRITVHKVIGYNGNPLYWATNAAGMYVDTNGLSSGGLQRGIIAAKADAIGYLGLPDFNVVSNVVVKMTYEGTTYTPANVANGVYPMWGYEHIVNRNNGLSPGQIQVRNALITAIKDPTYQTTIPAYNENFVSISEMNVRRGADGGPILSEDF